MVSLSLEEGFFKAVCALLIDVSVAGGGNDSKTATGSSRNLLQTSFHDISGEHLANLSEMLFF